VAERLQKGLPKKIRAWVRWCWVCALHFTGMLRWAKRSLAARQGVVVLTFHRVLPDDEFAKTFSPTGMVMRERTFEEAVKYAAAHHSPVAIDANAPAGRSDSGKLRVAFTFDDGWADNAHFAAPLARKHGVPLAIFVCPGRMGTSFPFWPERIGSLCEAAGRGGYLAKIIERVAARTGQAFETAGETDAKQTKARLITLLKTLPLEQRRSIVADLVREFGKGLEDEDIRMHSTMTWEELQELSRQGVLFGSHTQTHQILTKLSADAVERELMDSKQALGERLGQPCLALAYPNGDWSQNVRASVAKAGYRLAFRNDPGVWTADTDPLLIPRVNMWERSVVNPLGRFSPLGFDYAVFWRAYWRGRNAPRRAAPSVLSTKQPAPARTDTSN
jgi:peptidoglycan/xylan/chitin deacetylase (PgdA/CDA1 family)